MTAPRPLSPERLAVLIADRALERLDEAERVRIGVDGAPAAAPGTLADAVAEVLRGRGITTVRVHAADFLRPASIRLEYGRADPDSFLDRWLDADALRREVLDPWAREGTGRYLPTRWDADRDRATRAAYEIAPDRGVLLCDGTFLLGHDLPFDVTVHVWLSAGALRRRTPDEQQWTLPAFARYEEETNPTAYCDLVVRADDPRHPAVIVR